VLGIKTNLGLFAQLMNDADWMAGDLDTGFLDRFMQRFKAEEPCAAATLANALAAAQTSMQKPAVVRTSDAPSSWRAEGRRGLLR